MSLKKIASILKEIIEIVNDAIEKIASILKEIIEITKDAIEKVVRVLKEIIEAVKNNIETILNYLPICAKACVDTSKMYKLAFIFELVEISFILKLKKRLTAVVEMEL
ncbi:12557_t:CDS:2 [Gigaspora margarita]|uniref:12557_t:CDS:1 n=1 Tax=Gigaspora margarita TaxID=4874 RepID=A0ABN7VZK5_GIGMA|nr:12557_t:CDS:2 [Gigaspora margarita]